MAQTETETRSVSLSEVKSGVSLRSGHPTVLVVEGIKGRKSAKAAAQPDTETADTQPGGDHYVHHVFQNASGHPAEGVHWRVTKDGREVASGVTTASGEVSVKVPAQGDYHLEVADGPSEPAQPHPDSVEHSGEAQEAG